MKLKFDPNQDYQLQAIKSIAGLFEGQPLNQGEFELSFEGSALPYSDQGVGNKITLSEEQILKNLQNIQEENNINISDKLDGMHFSIEMETGTGKTYVYLRAIYGLNKLYGFKKFVIVVPSIAIREGVLKNLEITHEHFQNIYNKEQAHFEVYGPKTISNLRNYATSDNIQILVINIDSFAKDENIINKPNDRLTGKKPIEFIQYVNPIVIVDEPQNMETEIRRQAIENLHYSCTLRFSATLTNAYNLVYSLDPVQAYDLGLVKQIEVDSVVSEDDFNEAYIRLEKVIATKTKTSAKIKIDVNDKEGVKRKTVTVDLDNNYDLYQLSNHREIYQDLIVEEINVEDRYITLNNGKRVAVGDTLGGLTDEIMKFQINKTVDEHFRKEKKFKDLGIKVLSLFFIDKVANYRQYSADGAVTQGKFAEWFKQAFKEYASKPEYKDVLNYPVEKVHNGYFAQDKKGNWKDSKGSGEEKIGVSTDDGNAYHLIMRDKEKLLSQEEPLRFIFSHSALREGWDNPNVFQICTLNETKSELKKRQEIGRGLRLPVNQDGQRIFDKNINRLTVVANESYEDFAKQLQKEIEDDCGVAFEGSIKDKRKRVEVKYRKGFQLDGKFKKLWDKIKHQTTYRVKYNTDELIKKSRKAIIDMLPIHKPRIRLSKIQVNISKKGVTGDIKDSRIKYAGDNFYIPDIYSYIQNKTELTRYTIWQILKGHSRLKDVLVNPQLFLDYSVDAIKEILTELMIDGIKYEKIGSKEYEMRLFDEHEVEVYKDKLTFKVSDQEKTIYSNIIPLDSQVESDFAKECESRDDIAFYFKLPYWFEINTPIGKYNPDWALIKKNEKTIYFVAETKSKGEELRISEDRKIKCGRAHFNEFEGVEYKGPVSSVSDLD